MLALSEDGCISICHPIGDDCLLTPTPLDSEEPPAPLRARHKQTVCQRSPRPHACLVLLATLYWKHVAPRSLASLPLNRSRAATGTPGLASGPAGHLRHGAYRRRKGQVDVPAGSCCGPTCGINKQGSGGIRVSTLILGGVSLRAGQRRARGPGGRCRRARWRRCTGTASLVCMPRVHPEPVSWLKMISESMEQSPTVFKSITGCGFSF